MRLLDDVCLIESEVFAPLTASIFKRSITKLAGYEHSNLKKAVRGNMIGSHPGRKLWKNSRLFWRDSLQKSRSRV